MPTRYIRLLVCEYGLPGEAVAESDVKLRPPWCDAKMLPVSICVGVDVKRYGILMCGLCGGTWCVCIGAFDSQVLRLWVGVFWRRCEYIFILLFLDNHGVDRAFDA